MKARKSQQQSEEFVITLSPDDEVIVHFEREATHVTRFSVQYRARIHGRWQPIVRFDTAHGHAHKDISHPDGSQETQALKLDDYGVALTLALRDVKTQWEFYRERYERWSNGT